MYDAAAFASLSKLAERIHQIDDLSACARCHLGHGLAFLLLVEQFLKSSPRNGPQILTDRSVPIFAHFARSSISFCDFYLLTTSISFSRLDFD